MHTLMLASALLSAPALADTIGLGPQNRAHAGVNLVGGPSPVGISVGFDSRITRIIGMDMGLFATLQPIADDLQFEADQYGDFYRLRHGVYFAPGLRIPHPQPGRWTWDVHLRAGGGVLWMANVDPAKDFSDQVAFEARATPGGMLGVDLMTLFGGDAATRYGVRAFGRGWVGEANREVPEESYLLLRGQYGLEALVQW